MELGFRETNVGPLQVARPERAIGDCFLDLSQLDEISRPLNWIRQAKNEVLGEMVGNSSITRIGEGLHVTRE